MHHFKRPSSSVSSEKPVSGKPSLIYWNLHSRGDFSIALFLAGKVEYEIDLDSANSWPEKKGETPFGQLPVLIHGPHTIAQGGAINRYAARISGLYPTTTIEAAMCDMYMEEAMDIFSVIYKAKNAADKEAKIAQWKEIYDEVIPKHYGMLESHLEKSGKPFLCGDSPNAADVSIFVVNNIYDRAGLDMKSLIAKYPNLAKLVEETKKLGNLAQMPEMGLYFASDPEHESF